MNNALILAGGIGSRMNLGNLPKQYYIWNEKPLIYYTLRTFQSNENIDCFFVVADSTWWEYIEELIETYKLHKFKGFALPGENRQYSIFHGLEYISECGLGQGKVIIQDAARPFTSQSLINRCLEFGEFDGVMPVLPVKDTCYKCDSFGRIVEIPKREMLYAGQAPEAFAFELYYKAHIDATSAMIKAANGSSEFAHNMGLNIRTIQGEESNFKITTPDDLKKLELIKLNS